jgi:segregation and condensation protein A
MAVDVTTPVFEGPFDLLLHLILKEQVDIYEVSLSTIVDAYLAEVERLQALDLDIATEFLLIASTLVELKARRLLPGRDDVDLDEELALWEERDLLLSRLLEAKTFKDVAAVFSRLADEADRSFPRIVGPDDRYIGLTADPLEGTSPNRLKNAYLRAVSPKAEVRIDLFHVAPVRASVADAVAELVDELPRVGRITFRALTGALVERIEVIVRFLALLELFKQGVVELDQAERFGDIDIVWTGTGSDTGSTLAALDDYEG